MDLIPSFLKSRDTGSKIVSTDHHYKIYMDVHHFKPEEIVVKTKNRDILVEGRHDEIMDDHGFISRHFVRKYHLPEGHKAEEVVSSLSRDGVLTITAPRHEALEDGHRKVPIMFHH